MWQCGSLQDVPPHVSEIDFKIPEKTDSILLYKGAVIKQWTWGHQSKNMVTATAETPRER